MRGYLETTLEFNRCDVDVSIEYSATEGEPRILYLPDGSGQEWWPPEAEFISVMVTRWHVGGESRKRDGHWLWDALDAIASEAIEREWSSAFEDRCLEEAFSRDYDDE